MGSSSEITLGIDFGHSTTKAAAVIDGQVHFAVDSRGDACIPSVVYFPRRGPPLVGFEAERFRFRDPVNLVFGIKRLLGASIDSPAARLVDNCSAFRMVRKNKDDIAISTPNGDMSPEEVGSIILGHLKQRAEAKFGRKINRAVVTVPVTMTEKTRRAVYAAARMAGLTVESAVPEPCAAAVSVQMATSATKRKLLVYDFGAGTFDVSVLEQDNNKFHVLASGGDECLGGDLFDLSMAEYVANGIWKTQGMDITKDAVRWDQLNRQSEQAKRALSAVESTRMRLDDFCSDGEEGKYLDLTLHRSVVEPLWSEHVERSLRLSAEVLVNSGLRPQDLSDLVIAGGTTYIPLVRARLQAVFGRPLTVISDPQTSVVTGAAILAAKLVRLENQVGSTMDLQRTNIF